MKDSERKWSSRKARVGDYARRNSDGRTGWVKTDGAYGWCMILWRGHYSVHYMPPGSYKVALN